MAAHKLIMEDAAIIPLYQEAETQLRNPNLKGIIFTLLEMNGPEPSIYRRIRMFRT